MWDFETDPDFQADLDWADQFVTEQVEPVDLVLGNPFDRSDPAKVAVLKSLQSEVKRRGLWACHLGPELGGRGFGQLKLALLQEVLGRSSWAPSVFGCQAPDSGNAEILAHFGTPAQKERYLRPLLEGDVVSCYAMTEPHAGADPALFRTTATKVDGGWLLNGEKWFASNARYAAFWIVMAATPPEGAENGGRHDVRRGMSMFVLPAGAAGTEIVRNVAVPGEYEQPSHGYLRFVDAFVPDDQLLGERGQAFAIAQTRLGGGRMHHAMRTIAQLRQALDMMCERAVSRSQRTGTLADLQMTQERIADSWIEIEQFRLLVLRTAWLIDRHHGDYKAVRKDIAAVKAQMPKVFREVVGRCLHLHGALGASDEMPLVQMMVRAEVMGIADGPTEVHKVTLARALLDGYRPAPGLFPSAHLPTRRQAAEAHVRAVLEHLAANT